jgi:hypothetical protein
MSPFNLIFTGDVARLAQSTSQYPWVGCLNRHLTRQWWITHVNQVVKECSGYTCNSATARATTVRPRYYADLCYTRIFFRKLVPPTISYVWAIVHAVLVLEICHNIERTSRYNDGMMKSLAIDSLSISCNLDVYHFLLQSTELKQTHYLTIDHQPWSELWHTIWTGPSLICQSANFRVYCSVQWTSKVKENWETFHILRLNTAVWASCNPISIFGHSWDDS